MTGDNGTGETQGRYNRSAPAPPPSNPHRIDISKYVATARRRWPILLALPIAAGAIGFATTAQHRPTYTAQIVLQRQIKAAPLTAGGNDRVQSVAIQAVPAQLEVIRSMSVAGDVVDSLGLRAQVSAPNAKRSDVFAFLKVDSTAPSGVFTVQAGPARELELFEGKTQVATIRPEGACDYKGLHFTLSESASQHLPITISIADRSNVTDGLRFSINPTQVRGTPIVRVSYTTSDPVLSADVLNALGYAYSRHVARQAREEATRRRQFLAASLSHLGDSLRDAKAALTAYQQSSRMIDPKSEGQVASTELTTAENDLRTLQFQEGVLKNLLTSVQSSDPNDRSMQRMVSVSKELVPAIDEFYAQLRTLDAEKSRLTSSRFGYTAQGRNVQAIDSLIAVTRSDMSGATDEALQLLRAKRQSVEQSVNRLRETVAAVPIRATTFLTLQQNVDATQKTYDLLSQRLYEAQLSEAVEAGDVEIVDPARVPPGPDPYSRKRTIMIGLLWGLGLALAIVLIQDRLDQTVRTNQDAMDATGLQVLGTIPFFKNNDKRSMTGALESYRKLRTTLRFVRTEGKQVIMVTSPAPSEGKSATAANLAWVLANDKLRVVLVDADMRRPTQHVLFTKERFPGLSDVLVGEAELGDALVEHSGLTILPCGTAAPNPADLLSSAKFTTLITELRKKFDRVIVDCPPVHAVADATTIASESDGVLVIVRAEHTNGGALSYAVEQLSRAGADILGVVMNGVPSGSRGYGGYYGYYDYVGYRSAPEPRGMAQVITSPNGAAPKSRWRIFAST